MGETAGPGAGPWPTADSKHASREFIQLLWDFKAKDNQNQIETMSSLLKRIQILDQTEQELSRENLSKVLGVVMKTLITPGMTKLPNTIYIHADIVKECLRLFAKDTLWQKALDLNHDFAKKFQLDTLITSNDMNISKIGINMGSLIMLKVPSLELSDIVSDDYSMEKISQALLKYVLTNIAK